MDVFWTILLIQSIASAGFCAYLAHQKNRNIQAWLFLGFLFGLLALITIAALPAGLSRKETTEQHKPRIFLTKDDAPFQFSSDDREVNKVIESWKKK